MHRQLFSIPVRYRHECSAQEAKCWLLEPTASGAPTLSLSLKNTRKPDDISIFDLPLQLQKPAANKAAFSKRREVQDVVRQEKRSMAARIRSTLTPAAVFIALYTALLEQFLWLLAPPSQLPIKGDAQDGRISSALPCKFSTSNGG